jgi:hypothetical protein
MNHVASLSVPQPSNSQTSLRLSPFPLSPAVSFCVQGEHLTVGGNKQTVWQLDLMTGLTVLNTIDVPCGA